MANTLELDPDCLFPADSRTGAIARELYAQVAHLPIVSPHGPTDPEWFATDAPWNHATELFLAPLCALISLEWTPPDGIDVPEWRC